MTIRNADSTLKAARRVLQSVCVAAFVLAPQCLHADDWVDELLLVDPAPQVWEVESEPPEVSLQAGIDDESLDLIDGERTADGINLAPVAPARLIQDVPPAPPSEDSAEGSEPAQTPAPTPNQNTETPKQPLGQAPADNRLLVLRRSTVLLEPGQTAVDYGVQYRWQEFKGPTIADIPPGFPYQPGPALVNQRTRSRQLFVPAAVRYGFNETTQIFGQMPFGLQSLERSNAADDSYSNMFGTGDLTMGVNHTLWAEELHVPELVGTISIGAPLGADPFELTPGPSAIGSGFWQVSGSLLAIKTYDPAVVFGGVGYTHLFDRDYLGGTFDPGETFTYQFGTAFAVNDSVTFNAVFLGEFQTETKFNDRSLPGTTIEPFQMRFSIICAKSECLIIEPFCAIGLNDDAPEADIGVIITERF